MFGPFNAVTPCSSRVLSLGTINAPIHETRTIVATGFSVVPGALLSESWSHCRLSNSSSKRDLWPIR